MQVLQQNELKNYSTITSTNADPTTIIYNLLDDFLMKKYISSSTTDTLTFTLNDGYDIDCVAFGYHNLTSIVFKFYDFADTLLYTETISSPRETEMKYFTEVTAKKVVIDLVASSSIYLGGVSAGVNLQLPHFDIVPKFGLNIRSFTNQTVGGQSIGQKRTILRSIGVSFIDITQAQFDEIETLLKAVQNVDPIFLDIYSGSTVINPMYCKISGDVFDVVQLGESGIVYNGAMDFIECK